MKTRIIVIVLLILIANNNVSLCQKKINLDTTMCYVNNLKKEYVDVLEFCSKEFNDYDKKMNIKNYITLVKLNGITTTNEDFEMNVSQIYSKKVIAKNIPDLYTYINGNPVFFITGKSILIKKDSTQIKDEIRFFSRFIPDDNLDNLTGTVHVNISTKHTLTLVINQRNIPDNLKTLTREEVRDLKISPVASTGNSRIIYSPYFIIRKSNNEMQIEKVEGVKFEGSNR